MKTIAFVFLSLIASCKQTVDNPAPTPAPKPDRIEVLARHLPVAGQADLDADPVVVHFDKFTVTKASFDPKNLEGGRATIELDPTSMKTGSEERDNDLKAPEFLDVARFATVTIDVANVKKRDTKYSADATVACHGVTKTYPVTFEVLATTGTTVHIKGEHAFSRLDFSIGIDPATDPTERIAAALIIQWELTLKSS